MKTTATSAVVFGSWMACLAGNALDLVGRFWVRSAIVDASVFFFWFALSARGFVRTNGDVCHQLYSIRSQL
jgi:hypothetical protein